MELSESQEARFSEGFLEKTDSFPTLAHCGRLEGTSPSLKIEENLRCITFSLGVQCIQTDWNMERADEWPSWQSKERGLGWPNG
jgi:hypothetical protein